MKLAAGIGSKALDSAGRSKTVTSRRMKLDEGFA